jgi:hypothetical protein
LATLRISKLESIRRNTRQNPENKRTTPVSDPKKILKARGSLKPTTAVYQLKHPQPKTKSSCETSTSHSTPSETTNSFLFSSVVKSEILSKTSIRHKGKNPTINLSAVDIPLTLLSNFPTSPSLEEYTIYSNLTPAGSPDYVSYKYKEPSPRVSVHSSSLLSSPEEAKNLFLVFHNPLYKTPYPHQVIPMAVAGGGAGGQAPPPPPIVFTKVAVRYAPLVLPVPLHDLPENYIKNLPKFTEEGDLTAAEHINFFDQFVDILGLEHEDVYSILFVQTFEGQVRTWFRSLPTGSILSYDALEYAFLRQWGERKDHLYYLTEFGSLKKRNSKIVMEFIQRFNKLYNKIPAKVKPSQPTAKVTFAGAFEPDFALLLRERRGATLTRMQDDVVEIESNMMASGKLKARIETGNRETRRFREQVGPSGSNRSTDEKMDDMARVIK